MKIRKKKPNPKQIFPEHLADLKKSGISKQFALLNGLYSVDRDGLSAELGGQYVDPQVKTALVIPFSHREGFVRAKVFPPYTDAKGNTVKYLQRKDSGSSFYIPPCLQSGVLQDPSRPLTIIEGEKKVLAAIAKGLKDSIGISGIWNGIKDRNPIEDFSLVSWKDRNVTYVPDGDVWYGNPNLLEAVYTFVKFMEEAGARVEIVSLPNAPEGGWKIGLDDYFLTHSLEDFKGIPRLDLSNEIFLGFEDLFYQRRNKSDKRNNDSVLSPISLISPASPSAKPWPKPFPLEDFYGIAGDFVRLVDPATEADPIALYFQFLWVFGNVVGRTAHYEAEQDKHFMNLFGVLVGETSKGRKGSSWSQVRRAYGLFEEDWLRNHLSSGLSSGEGLIWAVRDPIEKKEPIKKKGEITGYQNVITDDGVEDKRLIVYEPEFASVLRVLDREGNTLSTQIRQAWETGTLRTLTKNSPAKATNAHISILGHITRDELRQYLHRTEAASGFGNRFLWLCVKRSKCLPEGGSYAMLNMMKLCNRLSSAVRFASKAEVMSRSEKARGLWKEIYPALSEGKPGMLGAVTARAEAQVMRLSCLFALLDEVRIVDEPHLKAALKLWDFAFQSAEHIWGKSLGDDVADRIYFELTNRYPKGMSLSEISALFYNHKGKERINTSLQSLLSLGLVCWEEVQTGGRKAKIIKAVLK